MPPGCAFAPRCARIETGHCDKDTPPLERIADPITMAKRSSACFEAVTMSNEYRAQAGDLA